MKIYNLTNTNNETSYLRITDLDNALDIVVDKRKNYAFNLNSTIYFNVTPNNILQYRLSNDMHWPIISFKLYATTRLAWVLMKLNNIEASDVLKIKHAGDIIRYVDPKQLESLIEMLSE